MSKYKIMAYMTVIAMLEILLVLSISAYQHRNSINHILDFNKGNTIELGNSSKNNKDNIKSIDNNDKKENKDSLDNIVSKDNLDSKENNKKNVTDSKVKQGKSGQKEIKDIEIVDEDIPMSDSPLDILSLDDLFEKALIIGDSRIISMYNRLHCDAGTFAFDAAVSSKNLKNKRLSSNKKIKGNAYSIVENNKNKYKKIYISVGLNDVNNTSMIDYYKNIKKYVLYAKNHQSKCKVYICSIIYMSEDKAGKDNSINKKIDKYNKQLKQIAIELNVQYVDLNNKMKNCNNAIKKRYTIDGINLNTEGCSMMGKILINNQ